MFKAVDVTPANDGEPTFSHYNIYDEQNELIGVMTVSADAPEYIVMRIAAAVGIARRPKL